MSPPLGRRSTVQTDTIQVFIAADGIFFFFFFFFFFVPCRKFGSPYLGKQPEELCYPFLSACAVFSCVQTMVWLSELGIFNVRTDADAWDCTRGLYGRRKRVCARSGLWGKNPLPHRALEPASVLCLTFQPS